MIVALLFACVADSGTPELESEVTDAETEDVFEIEVSQSAIIPTALEVRWSSDGVGEGWVEFETGGAAFQTPVVSDRNHRHVLLGAGPFEDVSFRVFTVLDGLDYRSGELVATTGDLDAPTATVSGAADIEDAWFLATVVDDLGSQLVMFDRAGQAIWALPRSDDGEIGEDAVLSDSSILYNRFSLDHSEDVGRIEIVDLAGEALEIIETEGAHNTFALLPGGGMAWVGMDARTTDAYGDVVGDQVYVRSIDGDVRSIFSTWDHAEVAESQTWESGAYPQGWDWTHASSLVWSEAHERYVLSLAGTDQILTLDEGGAVLQTFSGATAATPDYLFDPEDAAFQLQRGVNLTEDGDLLMLSLFGDHSRAIRYQIDDEAGALREIWSAGDAGDILALSRGGVQELPGGDLLVNWGSAGLLQQIDPFGEVRWELTLQSGHSFGEVQALASPYEPL